MSQYGSLNTQKQNTSYSSFTSTSGSTIHSITSRTYSKRMQR